MKITYGSAKIPVEEFEFDGRLYGGSIFVNYARHTDHSIDWEPELLRLVDVTDGEADWENDDICETIEIKTKLAQAVFAKLDDFILDCCFDDYRWL